jgi:hypothetical protein
LLPKQTIAALLVSDLDLVSSEKLSVTAAQSHRHGDVGWLWMLLEDFAWALTLVVNCPRSAGIQLNKRILLL